MNIHAVDRDNQGYLNDPHVWDEKIALHIAADESIVMTEAHWEVIHAVRDFYLKYNTSPAIRMLVKIMAAHYGEEKGNSRYLFRLFPQGPAKQATKIAGLPRPARCL